MVHEFDILGDTFTSKNIVLPVPIDDHVQDVWRDSLLYIINGWYDSTNVRRTQIYNPVSNNWSIGTPYNSKMIPTFGASGGINGDFIYIQGGARSEEMLFLRLVLITKVPLTLISLRKYLGKQRQVMILLHLIDRQLFLMEVKIQQ